MSCSRVKVFFLSVTFVLIVTTIIVLIVFRQPVFKLCDCGYVVNINNQSVVFTETLKTDFTQLADVSANMDWRRQEFNVTKEGSSGPYGKLFTAHNIYSSPSNLVASNNERSRSAGLLLEVKAAPVDDMVPGAEIATTRTDMFYGTYRARIKVNGLPGSCAAFFWYASDTAEIDIEFLSKDYDWANNSYPINLIIHDSQSGAVPKSAKKYLPFDPTADFHEYRFDFVPDFVDFFTDNQPLARLDGRDLQASRQPGHLVLQHWSNGDPRWSGGPPAQDALMTVAYVEAYFNSLSAVEKSKTEDPCPGPEAPLWLDRVCRVPDITTGNETQTTMVFTH